MDPRKRAQRWPTERFTSLIDKGDGRGCWNFTGVIEWSGYGRMYFDGSNHRAHRLAYELFVGPIGDLFVLHGCDNRRCVRPEHLYLGTQRDNIADMHRRGRAAVGDRSWMRQRPELLRRGEQINTAKLDAQRVRELAGELGRGVPKATIARRFDIAPSTVGRIASGKSWRHVLGGDAPPERRK